MLQFTPYQLGKLSIKNRIVMPPMCMYCADSSGKVTDFHHTHYESRAIGGVGLIIVEATGVVANGRISENDLGLWNSQQQNAFVPLVNKIKQHGTRVGIQLAHSGRKHIGMTESPVGPSPIGFDSKSRVPHELTFDEIQLIIEQFGAATRRADNAGFDTVEIHAAHGYLIHEFLSPLSNHRTDDYGGSYENRLRLLKEILIKARSILSPDKPLLLRISATDYLEGGLQVNDFVNIVNDIKEYIDIVHVSSGGLLNVPMDVFPGYQLHLSETIKKSCHIDTIAVGLITDSMMIEEILGNRRADLVALGRELLRNPYFVLQQAKRFNQDYTYPVSYERGFK